TLADLRHAARVGTSSLRRQAQLRHVRPDLDLRDLRGNVDTRLRKVQSGEYEAVVVSKAGLDRLGFSQRISEVLSPDVCMPAVGQGAIAVECRLNDREAQDLLAPLDDPETRAAVIARASAACEDLARELSARGATPVWFPLVSFAEPDDFAPLDRAITKMQQFDWLILTSAQAVRALIERAADLQRPLMRTDSRV